MDNLDYKASYGWQRYFGDTTFSFGFISGYKTAGDVLVDKKMPDLLLFPIIFNYRQYMELVLKHICYSNMNIEDYNKIIKKVSHHLKDIWVEAKKFINISNQDITYINDVVSLFEQLDDDSMKSRYEFDKQGNRMLADDFDINTLNLKICIENVDKILYFTYGD